MAEKSGRALQSRGVRRVSVSSRHIARAGRLAADLGADAVPFENRESRLAEADIVVCSTAAPSTVISANAVAAAMRIRPARPLLLIDLAMPRDIEVAAGELPGVFLYNLDDLARVAEKNRRARQAEAVRGRLVLAPRADALWEQVRNQLVIGAGTRETPADEACPIGRPMAPAAFA